jgi:hypothetical protein
MSINKHYIVLAAWLLMLLLSSRLAYSQNPGDAWLTQEQADGPIDLCGSSSDARTFYLVFNIGNVTSQDSLFGYDFGINFNPQKIKFDAALYINTLSENMEFKEIGFQDTGKVRGTAGNLSNIDVYGDKPLLVLVGKFLENCYDTAFVNLEYLEFTDEFKKPINNYVGVNIVAAPVVDNSRNGSFDFSENMIKVMKNDEFVIHSNLKLYSNDARLDSLDAMLVMNNNFTYFKLEEINTENPNIIIDSYDFDSSQNTYIIHTRLLQDDSTQSYLNFKMKCVADGPVSDNLSLSAIKTNYCTCVSAGISEKNMEIQDTIPIVSDINEKPVSGAFIADEVIIYNIEGMQITKFNLNNSAVDDKIIYSIISELPKDIYLVLIYNTFTNEYKTKLLNN